MKDKQIYLISSVTQDGSIGNSETNGLIYTSEQDMALFKSLTLGHTVIMGRNTWESLPDAPLEGRFNKVISTTLTEVEGAEVYTSIEEAIMSSEGMIYILGGSMTFNSIMHYNPIMYLSIWKDEELTGDLKFPNYESISENYKETLSMDRDEFVFKKYVPIEDISDAQKTINAILDQWGDNWDVVEGILGIELADDIVKAYGK